MKFRYAGTHGVKKPVNPQITDFFVARIMLKYSISSNFGEQSGEFINLQILLTRITTTNCIARCSLRKHLMLNKLGLVLPVPSIWRIFATPRHFDYIFRYFLPLVTPNRK